MVPFLPWLVEESSNISSLWFISGSRAILKFKSDTQSCDPADQLQGSLCPGVCPRKRGCRTECPAGCLWGPSGPALRSVQKVSRECPQSVKKVSRTLWGHSRDTFWTLRSPGPRDTPRDTPSDTPIFGDTLGDTPPAHDLTFVPITCCATIPFYHVSALKLLHRLVRDTATKTLSLVARTWGIHFARVTRELTAGLSRAFALGSFRQHLACVGPTPD